MKTKTIRLSEEAIKQLYKIAGELQMKNGEFFSPSKTLEWLYNNFKSDSL